MGNNKEGMDLILEHFFTFGANLNLEHVLTYLPSELRAVECTK